MPVPWHRNGLQVEMGPPPGKDRSSGHETALSPLRPGFFNMGHGSSQPTARVQGNDCTPDAVRLLRVVHLWEGPNEQRRRHSIHNPEYSETSGSIHYRSISHNCEGSGRCGSTPAPGATATRTDSTGSNDAYQNHTSIQRHGRPSCQRQRSSHSEPS